MDYRLKEAAIHSNISIKTMQQALPTFVLHTDPNLVSYTLGEQGVLCILYSQHSTPWHNHKLISNKPENKVKGEIDNYKTLTLEEIALYVSM